jgi:carbamoyl-phosphate synthase large subunit
LQKALRGLEVGKCGFDPIIGGEDSNAREILIRELTEPGAQRIWYLADAFRQGWSVDKVSELSGIDPWFLVQIADVVKTEQLLIGKNPSDLGKEEFYDLKRQGFSDVRLSHLFDTSESEVQQIRHTLGVRPVYKRVDTCAGEFVSSTAYVLFI